MRNSKVMIVQNIKLNKDYKSVLSYTSAQMLALCNSNKLAENSTFSFIRQDENTIEVNFSYSDCLKCNYIAFQNPNYDNKWFFAFIDNVKYINDSVVRISFTIDVWSTFYDDLTINDCFVIREHTNDDTIGLNTVPENVELGEFIINESQAIDYTELSLLNNMYYIVGISTPIVSDDGITLSDTNRIYGGLYSGLYYIAFRSSEDVSNFLLGIDADGKANNIYSVFILPKVLIPTIGEWLVAKIKDYTFTFAIVPSSSSPIKISDVSININSSIDSYVPKNKKLYTAPFNYLVITNNLGSEVMYRYEDFSNNNAEFKIVGTVCVGASIKMLPMNYKKTNTDTDANSASIYGLNCGKYPTCSWNSDSYTNWLTQNSVNIALQTVHSSFNLVSGVVTQNALQAGVGLASIANEVSQVYQASFMPVQAKGNVNAGDITYSGGMIGFRYLQMSVRAEYARIIDDYFSAVGYKTNRLKKPNLTGRQNWNYVQVSSDDDLAHANIPHEYLNTINDFARRGFTVWHSHEALGNYSLDNSIVS